MPIQINLWNLQQRKNCSRVAIWRDRSEPFHSSIRPHRSRAFIVTINHFCQISKFTGNANNVISLCCKNQTDVSEKEFIFKSICDVMFWTAVRSPNRLNLANRTDFFFVLFWTEIHSKGGSVAEETKSNARFFNVWIMKYSKKYAIVNLCSHPYIPKSRWFQLPTNRMISTAMNFRLKTVIIYL